MVLVFSVCSAFAVYCKSTHFFVSVGFAYEAVEILITLVLLFFLVPHIQFVVSEF